MRKGVRLVQNGDGSQEVQFGAIASGLIVLFIGALAASLISVALLGWRATHTEADLDRLERCTGRQARNQLRLDERQRQIRKDVIWANRKLDKVLAHMQVPDRVPEPDLPPSSLEIPPPDSTM